MTTTHKKFYTSYSKLSEVKLITIGLASPERIKQWAEKTLPNGKVLGEVMNANTLHHKTFKPQKGGLFCERIFGPLKDFECVCGKPLKYKKGNRLNQKALNLVDADPNKSILGNPAIKTRNFCNICEVEYTWSVMRRYQLGYIKLISPVTHVWYLKNNPSYLSILLDIKKRHLEYVTYCSESLTIENALKGKTSSADSSDIVSSWNKLKQQIIDENTIKLAANEEKISSPKVEFVQSKIRKRQNLKIKKQGYWQRFYLNPTNIHASEVNKMKIKESLSFKDFNPNPYDYLNMEHNLQQLTQLLDEKNGGTHYSSLITNFRNYFKKINIQSLLFVSIIFNQIKWGKAVNNFESLFLANQSPKKFLKSISVSFYIFLKLNQNSQFLTSKLINQVWSIFAQKAIKKSLIRMNQILRKMDSIYFQEKFLSKDDEDFLVSKIGVKRENSTQSISDSDSENLMRMKTTFDEYHDYGKFLKNSLNKLCYQSLMHPKTPCEFSLYQQNIDSIDLEINNKQFLLKTDLYLKFYTLSKFTNKDMQFLFKNKMCYEILSFKPFLTAYKVLFKKLTDMFLKMLLISSGSIFKTIPNMSQKSLFLFEHESKHIKNTNIKLTNRNFRQFFFLLNSIQTKHEKVFSKFFEEKSFITNLFEDPNENIALRNSNSENLFKVNTLKGFNKVETPLKKIYNNIYSLSHRERWEAENDWNFFHYFMTSPYLEGEFIANYKNRHENITAVDINPINSNSNFSNISPNLHKSAFFSGPGIIQQLLMEFNFYEIKKIDKQNRILLYQLNKRIFKLKPYAKVDRSLKKDLKEAYKKRDLLIRRTKLIRKLFIKESTPESTILTVLPVLPPDLRPIVKMGGQIAASDLNRLYQRVIYRNDRLKKFLKDPATSYSYEMKYAQRLLQEAVDNLIQNGKSGVVSEKDSRGRALKSLSDVLKGKQGRFRQYLLGKRVDYSGRSVIVVGPRLKLHECGIPKEMALELYLPFLLKRILNENLSKTVVGAKTLIKTNPSLTWELLREIMQTCPVLLNRAPTLHRLGIQSFQPKLIEGRAILLHPLVCSAFNADFDGDQMAVHVPITVEARAEAWKLMLSRNNILSPATGDPLAIPSQDMVLGCYYLTTNLLNKKTQNFMDSVGSGFYYSRTKNVLRDYDLKKIHLHANIWLKWENLIENGMDQEEPIEIRIDNFGNWKEISSKNQKNYTYKNKLSSQYILTTPGKVLFNEIILKCLKN